MSKPIVWVDLPKRKPHGHEQRGRRPCIMIFDPATLQPTRFPMVLVIPLTSSFDGTPPLYVPLPSGSGNLPQKSTALIDQMCFIDAERVAGYMGTLTEAEYQPIQEVLRTIVASNL